jgi:hypothetical protein
LPDSETHHGWIHDRGGDRIGGRSEHGARESVSFSVTWGSNISRFRWSRVWAGIESPGDEDSAQSVTIQSEGSAWSLSNPASTATLVTLRGTGQSGAPVVARIQLLSSQEDTF